MGETKTLNIIWDFDGTIFDTYPRIFNAFDFIFNEKYHLNVSMERIEELVLLDTKECVKVIAKENEMEQDSLLREVRLRYDNHGDKESVFPEVLPILKDLDNYKHFLVTHRDRSSLIEKLNKFDIENCFIDILSKDEGFPDKPDPESFNFIIDKYALKKSDAVAIGDRDLDVGAGTNAGIKSILISSRKNHDATLCIENHSKLEEALRRLGGDCG